jgi:HPt (histidine-containing phosphotransfer) domain-containing protein
MANPPNPETGPFDVRVAPEIASLVPEFLEQIRERCRLIRGAAERRDLQQAQATAHQIIGSGGTYGFERISEFGRALESAAEMADVQELHRLVAELEHYLLRVKVVT